MSEVIGAVLLMALLVAVLMFGQRRKVVPPAEPRISPIDVYNQKLQEMDDLVLKAQAAYDRLLAISDRIERLPGSAQRAPRGENHGE